jgi:glycosyltransferase involved in cell wall biosynthesis
LSRDLSAVGRPVVLLVSHSSPGGVQELWSNLADGLRARGFATRLLALYPPGEPGDPPGGDPRWSYVVGRRPSSPAAPIGLIAALVRFIRREKPAAIISAMPAANVMAAAASRIAATRTPVVITHHSPVDTHHRLLDAADGLSGSASSVACIVSVSHAVETSLAGRPTRYRAKSRVIRNALPPEVESQLARLAETRRGRARGRVVVALGRLAAQKNYPLLIHAAKHLRDVRIRIVGGGPDEAELKALAQVLRVTDRVEFLGPRSRAEALDLLAAADVFVQPSLFEGHSLALLEAAALGIPIIVSRVPAQVEGVTASDGTPCGIIVALGDAAGFARAIEGLLDDEQAYGSWADRARHLSRTTTYESMVSAYAHLLDEVASGARDPAVHR